MKDNDFGYFGRGLDGYVHYTQAANETKKENNHTIRPNTVSANNITNTWNPRLICHASNLWYAIILGFIVLTCLMSYAYPEEHPGNIIDRIFLFLEMHWGFWGLLGYMTIATAIAVGTYKSHKKNVEAHEGKQE